VEVVTSRVSAAVVPTASASSRLRPLDAGNVTIGGGFWGDRLRINRERTIPHGFDQLVRAGNLTNLRLAAGEQGHYQALGEPLGLVFPFLDSDVYKWLEAVGWELGRAPDPDLARSADEAIALVAAAQRPDGYLNSFVQVVTGGVPYRDMAWGHELYCIGHLIQAAVAWHRALGDDRLLDVALRAVEHVDREFGPAGREGIDGHPEIEMALVELYRTTRDRRHLELARLFIDRRGRGILGPGRFGSRYWQDHAPVRDAASVTGHAVRQLYLDCGAVDVATELGDDALLGAVIGRWRDMLATRSYLTGGLGSRDKDEAFGAPFELPPDRAYTETCAGIASVMLAWRLLLATGEPVFADTIERTIYNAVLPGLSLDGTSFFYVNPLQRRTGSGPVEPGDGARAPWFPCACCPPNLMRVLSSWEQVIATAEPDGIGLQQYATASVVADVPGGRARLSIETDYPWDGRVALTVAETPSQPWTLSLRVPGWCRSASLTGPGDVDARAEGTGTIRTSRAWQAGDTVVLTLDMPARVTAPDARIDAVRGSLAFERGPLVYCIETSDLPAGVAVEDVAIEPMTEPALEARPDLADPIIGLRFPAVRTASPTPPEAWPYTDRSTAPAGGESAPADAAIEIRAIPYFAWANRTGGAMRVWIPAVEPGHEVADDGPR
jgi:DUF1680 family protein